MPDPGVRQTPKQGAPIPPKQVVAGVPDRELWDRLKAARGEPINIYDESEGRMRSFEMAGRSARPRPGTRIPLDMRPTPIPPDQLTKAYDDAAEFISSIEADHPILANAIIQNPNLLPLLPEISMMLGSASPLGADVTGSLLDAMPNAINYRSYAETMFETPVQQMFWQDVASQFDSGAKDVISYLFAGLEERGADRVSSLAFAWLKENPLEDRADQDELLLRLWNWSDAEQQTELHDQGVFGFLDAPQEAVENLLELPVNGLIGWLGDPEEAIRRSGLTLGQQAAYQMGYDPDDTGWSISSGVLDAIGEVVLDPLNAVAGLGAGVKAAKTIPLSLRAVKAGRLAFAARSALPVAGRAISPLKTRSITARITYAFKAKTVDSLFDTFGATSAGKEAFTLLKEGNQARFIQRFPQFDKLPLNFFEAGKFLESPEDMAELMKHIHYTDNMVDPDAINVARKALTDAKEPLDVLKAQMKVDMLEAPASKIFVVTDLPTKPARFLGRATEGREGHIANLLRRSAADLTQGVPAEINMFDTRKGLTQLRQVMDHYGVELGKKEELLNKFLGLELGDRQAFFLHEVMPAIGDATKNPLLRYDLVEIYRRSEGVRAYAKGLDEVVDDAGDIVRKPIIPSQMQAAFPIPIREIDQIIRRYDKAHRLGGALTMGRRGLVGPTKQARAALLQRLRNQVGDKLPDDITDEDLYTMAYSWLGQGIDPRGWVSKGVAGFNSKLLNPLDMAFRKAMLGLRPFQWLFKVVILEEPIRSHVYEMPNMYTRPLGWTQAVMSNHYLNKSDDWARKQWAWVDNVQAQTMQGVKTTDEAVARIRETFGAAADQILGKTTPRSVAKINQRLGSWLHKASLDSAQAKLIPGINLSRRLRAWKVNQASNIRSRELLSPSFRPKDDIQDIQHKMLYTMFGDELATSQSGVVPFHWSDTMATGQRLRYGHAWGGKVVELSRDPATAWQLRRMAGATDLTAEAFMETHAWQLMKGNIRRFFPDESTDVARAERYLNEKVQPYIEETLKPVLSQAGINRQEFLGALVENRTFRAEVNGHKYDIDLSSTGSAQRKLADMVEDQSTFARTTPFPEEIAAVPFNPRFLDGSGDKNAFRRLIDWNIKTFGEDASQAFNRRPFWRAQRRKWLEHYRNMGVPDSLAAQLASDKASQMVNYVMYDISEAPTVIKRLNNALPFFGATYEVMSTWTYKMPVATGGYWPLGIGGFGRKIDRLMRAFVNTGLVRVTEEDGRKQYELQMWREPDTGTPLGDALSNIGYLIRRTPENAIASIAAMMGQDSLKEGLELSEAGYGFSLGNPINPMDFGILSFAQAHIGMAPAANWITSSTMGKLLPAADVQHAHAAEATTLADMADRLEVEVDDLARANPGLFTTEQYNGVFSDETDPMEVVIPAGTNVVIPGSSLFETVVEDTFFPFGEIDTPGGIIRGMIPAMYQHIVRGFGLQGTPSDPAMSGDLDSIPFFSTPVDNAAVNSQLLEAFYYIESVDGTFTDKIFPMVERYEKMVAAGGSAEADELKKELDRLTAATIKRATDMAGGALILRGLGGGFFPNTGRALRQELTAIDQYWDSREFADQLRGNDADGNKLTPLPLGRLKKPEDIDTFFGQVGNWLEDPTGDQSRIFVRQNNPGIFAYLQPKTFWGEAGVPPEISSYEDYLDQIKSGQRKPVPLAVAIQRHLHAGVEADYWTDFVTNFGNDPEEATSRALDNYHIYSELQDNRHSGKDALFMSDDLHGGEYLAWLDERGSHADDEYESVETAIDRQREAYNLLQDLLDMDLDATMTQEEIRDHRTIIKTTLARFSEVIDQLEGEAEDSSRGKNPYELAMNTYWIDVYEQFEKATDPIWDAIAESTDTEKTSLLFENLKIEMNEWAQQRQTLFGRTDISYPSPLDIKWQRRTEEEKKAWALKRSTLPMEWLNLDDVERILTFAPSDAAQFFPTSREEMDIYTAWTVQKNEIDEMKEAGLISESDRRKAQDAAEEAVRTFLTENGRGSEILYMDMLPIEKLYVTNQLPLDLQEYMPEIRFIKESLAAEGKTMGSTRGDEMLTPLYQSIRNRAETDVVFGEMLRDLGLTIADESAYDAILPKLIVGGFESDF